MSKGNWTSRLIEQNIINLFQRIEGKPLVLRQWVAEVIGLIALADKVIHPNETPYLITLFRVLQQDSETLKILHQVINAPKNTTVMPIEISQDIGEQVLFCMLSICVSDRELHQEESSYLEKVNRAMGFPKEHIHRLINTTLHELNLKSAYYLFCQLDRKEKYWLMLVIVKSVYASHQAEQGELSYLNDIYQLIGGDSQLLETIKHDTLHRPLSELASIVFPHSVSKQVLTYLSYIFISNEKLTQQEIKVLREVGFALNYDEGKLEALITSAQKVFSA